MHELECDRFGPWVIEISEIDPPSPIFLPYLNRDEPPFLSIKIPRKLERRSARPGMHLYDYLVALYQHDLVVLHRVDETVEEHTFPYQTIQWLRYGENLLKGTLSLGLPDNALNLPFNTISGGVMQRLVAHVRGRYGSEASPAQPPQEPGDAAEGLSYYFDNLLARTRAQTPQFHLLAAQPEKIVEAPKQERLRSIIYGITGKCLLESLHLCDGRELLIVTRGQDFRFRWQTVYAKEFTYIPLENIRDICWQIDARHTNVSHLVIETCAGPLSFPFLHDNPFILVYDRFLTTLLGSHSPDSITHSTGFSTK